MFIWFRDARANVVMLAVSGLLGAVGGTAWFLHDAWVGMTLPCATIGGAELERAVHGRVEAWRHDQHWSGCRTQGIGPDQREIVSVGIERGIACSARALGGEAFALEGGGELSERGGITEIRIPVTDGCIAIRVGDGSMSIARDDVAALARAVADRRDEAAVYVQSRR